ncbi:Gfo/Idh/MocA family protein [Oceanobacillus halophilus]|uniref:Gfo/Idh/MocA family oxidoreductase n=1 Tax=Oceanobacillus halophilus TaxID=930130 RepID=A0A495ADN2_9BACI|nr:Gfo/Idh/MocA family oxidoreductase [Oceanobacillus halophilus]RKQ37962.1 gfo/Idh/MocA family oxidoreductase [Oceanobacillus halophilus]
MTKPKVGMVGLGAIAQKAYLPILTNETDWDFVGAFSPSKDKRTKLCKQYRIQDYSSLSALASSCDAVFVHSSTSSHYEVISELLSKGKDIYVDKPLASTINDAEKLVKQSNKLGRKLMVGFNRRFAPMYIEAKQMANHLEWGSMEKHRSNKIGPYSYDFTMLDDYIHVVDTIRWLAGEEKLKLAYSNMKVNKDNQLQHAQHIFESDNRTMFQTAMHRNAGSNLEQLELYAEGVTIRIKNMHTVEIEKNNRKTIQTPPSWDSVLKQRGFEGAVYHFIQCLNNDENPKIDGLEALRTQMAVTELI